MTFKVIIVKVNKLTKWQSVINLSLLLSLFFLFPMQSISNYNLYFLIGIQLKSKQHADPPGELCGLLRFPSGVLSSWSASHQHSNEWWGPFLHPPPPLRLHHFPGRPSWPRRRRSLDQHKHRQQGHGGWFWSWFWWLTHHCCIPNPSE